jgi:hypothetical protein
MDEILADYYEAELELLAGFLEKVTAAGVIAAALSDRGMLSHPGQPVTTFFEPSRDFTVWLLEAEARIIPSEFQVILKTGPLREAALSACFFS